MNQKVSIPKGFVIPTKADGSILWPDDFERERAEMAADPDSEHRRMFDEQMAKWAAETTIIQQDKPNNSGCWVYAIVTGDSNDDEENRKMLWFFCMNHGLSSGVKESSPEREAIVTSLAIAMEVIPHGFIAREMFHQYILAQFELQKQEQAARPVMLEPVVIDDVRLN